MIQFIELSNKQYPIFFSQFVLAQFGEGKPIGELFASLADVSKLELMQVYKLAYAGFKAGARKEKQEFKYSLEEFSEDILDAQGNEGWMEKVFEVIPEFFPEPENKKEKKSKPKAAKS